MYSHPKFIEDRPDHLHQLIKDYPLATFTSYVDQTLQVNHFPMYLDTTTERAVLQGHIPKANPIWRHFDEREIVVVFHGPQSYVTPNWYPSKLDSEKVVPTWNYAVVQVRGTPTAIQEPQWLLDHLAALTGQQESLQPNPWLISQAPEDFINRLVEQLVGIEVPVLSLIGKLKVGQNRNSSDREGVISGLLDTDGDMARMMAQLMADHRS
ncbi:MAG: FMN-binding negative transcriptional regulator [Pseudomonadota bacterium]